MNDKFLTLFSFILLILISGCNHSMPELSKVDKAIDKAPLYQSLALSRADSLAQVADTTLSPRLKVERLIQGSDAYKSLDLERSLFLLKQAKNIVETDSAARHLEINVLLKLASLYNSEGLMAKEASEIFNSLDPNDFPPELHLEYYILGVQINKNLGDQAFDPDLKLSYVSKASEYRDSVLSIDPLSSIIAANKLIENSQYREALHLLKSEAPPQEDDHQRVGPYYHYLANLYKQLEVPDSQIYFLALAAEDDLKQGVREYIALSQLAEALEPFDINRAFKYISQSRNDAEASHSSIRQREITPIYNAISHTYSQRQKQKTVSIILVALSLFALLVVFLVTALMLRKKNSLLTERGLLLHESKINLENANQQLMTANSRLAEESRIKEYFIRAFMQLCLSYLAKMESFRARLGKIASDGNLKKVTDAINSSRYVKQEISEFYENFDNTFLSLYPDFISILNSFLSEENRYPEDSKLNTELRVYALIWLGIETSGEISKFLRCSESTVYNYRTMMRNKAICRQDFEREFIRISQTKRHQ